MTTRPNVAIPGVSPAAPDGAPRDDSQQTSHDGPTTRAVSYVLGLISASLVAGGFSLGVYPPNLHNGLIAAAFTAVGLFVLRLRLGHREGWLFVATGVVTR